VWGGAANRRARGAAAAATALALTAGGCGGSERRDAGAGAGTYTVDIVDVSFPARQHLAEKPTFAITVRNAGDRAIPNLAVTVSGFTGRSESSIEAGPRRLVWVVDDAPKGAVTSVEDTWTAGALAPGRRVTLRWRVTPVVAGTHELRYAVAAQLAGGARTRLTGGGRPRGRLTVRVDDRPPDARVDPRTGDVERRSRGAPLSGAGAER
jgi:hypothetical protein